MANPLVPVGWVLLAPLGAWLMVYRVPFRTRCQFFVQATTTATVGVSLCLLSPLVPWSPSVSIPVLSCVGILLVSITNHGPTLACIEAGIYFGVFLWHLLLSKLEAPALYPVALAVTPVILTLLVAGIGYNKLQERFLLPLLGALLLTLGATRASPEQVLSRESCGMTEPFAGCSPLTYLCVWLVVAFFGVLFQSYMLRQPSKPGDLSENLMPGQTGERPTTDDNKAYLSLVDAIYADPSEDLSHLSANERRIVEICRTDEDEKYRVVHGGGLV